MRHLIIVPDYWVSQFVAIAKIAIKFYSVQSEDRKEIFSLPSWKTPNYQEKSAWRNPRMTNANRRLGSEILGAITLKNVITPATNFPEFAFSSISSSPRIIFRESRAILKIKKREEEDKERLQQSQFARVNPKWFLIPFPRNERTRLFPPSTFIFLFSPFSRSPVVLPLTSLSLQFSPVRGVAANVLSPDMTEFHGLSGRFSTKEGKFCEIVLARGTKEINSVARAGPRVWDDDAFKAQASGAPSPLFVRDALNTHSPFQIYSI